MAAANYLVYIAGAADPCTTLIDGIHCMLINDDDGQTAAQTCATADAILVAAGHAVQTPYFGSRLAISTMDADSDNIIILPRELDNNIT